MYTALDYPSDRTTAGLHVTLRPLLRCIDCDYLCADGSVETSTIERVSSAGGDYLRLFTQRRGGWYKEYDADVSYSYQNLCDALCEQFDIEWIMEILDHPVLKNLAERDFRLDRVIAISRYLRYDYPMTYYIILASKREIRGEDQHIINRELLEKYLDVSNLTRGQLTALRNLDLSWHTPNDVKKAIVVLARRWPLMKRFVVHQPCIHPHVLLLIHEIVFNEPEVSHCRWFNYSLFMSINDGGSDKGEDYLYSYQTAAVAFLFKWYLLRERCVNPVSLNNRIEFEIRFDEEMDAIHADINLPMEATQGIMDRVVDRFVPYLRKDAGELYEQWAGDYEFNNEKSDTWPDETPFRLSPLKSNGFFTQIITAGDLRTIANYLHNCAALRVDAGVSDKAEFWKYYDKDSGEVALLQLDPITRDMVEFNGMRNEGVSEKAKERMGEWLKA